MTRWAIYLTASGELVSTFTSDTHPRFNGFPWESDKHTATQIGEVDPAIMSWSPTAKAFAEDAAKVDAMLIAQVKAESERRTMLIYTANRGKMREYAKKAQEVIDFRALGQEGVTGAVLMAAFSTLPATARRRKFVYAQADAAKRGDSVSDAIARFEAGMSTAEVTVANLKAVEADACARIRAATTPAGKRAVLTGIDWSWTA